MQRLKILCMFPKLHFRPSERWLNICQMNYLCEEVENAQYASCDLLFALSLEYMYLIRRFVV